MKIKKALFIVILGVGLFNLNTVFAADTNDQKQVTATQGSGSEFDILLGEDGKEIPVDVEPGPLPGGPGGPPMEGIGGPDGRFEGGMPGGPRGPMGDRDRPGFGRRDDMRFGDRGESDRRPRWGQTDPKELQDFLKIHEPELSAKLEKMQQEDSAKYRRKIGVIGRIYGPVMQQMERNPEMGKLSLQRIRLRLKSEQQLRLMQSDTVDKVQAKAKLRESIAELFDVILLQEKSRQELLTERMNNKSDNEGSPPLPEGNKSPDRGEREKYPMRQHFLKRFEQHKELLEVWGKNRDKIIDQRVEQMVDGNQPFPWGR